MTNMRDLWIIVPCFNEEKILPQTCDCFISKLHKMKEEQVVSTDSIILFVDDGSYDDTWNIIFRLSEEHKDVHGLKLKENVGQQRALLAGLMTAKDYGADMTVTMDCDGQDDINAVTEMVHAFDNGYNIVYGVRNNRDTDTWLKRNTALLYYNIMRLFDKTMIYNHSEFRLMSYKVLCYLDAHDELDLFIRKICSSIAYYEDIPATSVYYKRLSREAGDTHYSFSALVKLAIKSLKPVEHEIGHVSHAHQYTIETSTYKKGKVSYVI